MEWLLFIVGAFAVVVLLLWRSRARMSWREGPLGTNIADRMPDKIQPPPSGGPTGFNDPRGGR
jgi:hypothetical protein